MDDKYNEENIPILEEERPYKDHLKWYNLEFCNIEFWILGYL